MGSSNITLYVQVLLKFRSKIKVRVDAVACILCLIPVGILAALLVRFSFKSCRQLRLLTRGQGGLFSKSGVTPKFFVMSLYLSLFFLVAVSLAPIQLMLYSPKV